MKKREETIGDEVKRLEDATLWLKSKRKIANDNDLAMKLGYKKSTLSNMLNGNTDISKPFIKKLCSTYTELNEDWLLSGTGDMLIQQGEQNVNISGDSNSNIGNRNTSNYGAGGGGEKQKNTEGIPLIPFDCIAGYGEDNSGIKLNNCERYNIPDLENIGAEFLVRVGGSSMYPKYSSGDILACKKVHDILFFQWGKIYIIDSSQGQLIKRIFQDENEDMIQLVSDNREKYPPFSIPKSDIRSLSIVLGVVRME